MNHALRTSVAAASVVALGILQLALSGCGQKGALTLPAAPQASAAASSAGR